MTGEKYQRATICLRIQCTKLDDKKEPRTTGVHVDRRLCAILTKKAKRNGSNLSKAYKIFVTTLPLLREVYTQVSEDCRLSLF